MYGSPIHSSKSFSEKSCLSSACFKGRDDSKKPKILPINFVPSEYNVLCGRGSECFSHIGNKKFRDFIVANLERYHEAVTKYSKSALIGEVFDLIQLQCPNGGGFVRKNLEDGRYYEVGECNAREKISQAFRDALRDQNKLSSTIKRPKEKAAIAHSVSDPTMCPFKKKRTRDCLQGPRSTIDWINTDFTIMSHYNSLYPMQDATADLSSVMKDALEAASQSTSRSCMRDGNQFSTFPKENIQLTEDRPEWKLEKQGFPVRSTSLHELSQMVHESEIDIDPDWINDLRQSEPFDIDTVFEPEDASNQGLHASTKATSLHDPIPFSIDSVDFQTASSAYQMERRNDPWDLYLDSLTETNGHSPDDDETYSSKIGTSP